MNKLLTSLLLVCLSCNAIAQGTGSLTREPGNNTWVIKGKVLPWLALGSGINYNLDIEYGFAKNKSVGLELTYNDYSEEHDVYDTTKKSYVSGPRMYTVDRGVLLYFRRYLNIDSTWAQRVVYRIFKSECLPYISPFVRYGKTDYHYDAGYVTSQLSYDEWQYSTGILVGMVCNVVDFNVGPFYKQRYITDIEMEGQKTFYTHMKPIFGLRVGANIVLFTRKNSNHCISKYAVVRDKAN